MKKINNKVLAIGLVVLVGIFLVARLVRAPKLEGNVRRDLVSLDITKVTEVRIAAADSSVSLLKENGKWNVQRGNDKFEADSSSIARMLQGIRSLQATSMASRKKDKWSEFKVDSTATHVSVFYDDDEEADFYIGRLGFNQNPGSGGQFDSQSIQPYTYIRLDGEDEVYIIDGFLGSSVPIGLNDWKKKLAPKDSIN